MKNLEERLIATIGWLGSSFLVAVCIGFLTSTLEIEFWYNLSWGVKIPICMIIGYFLWFPYWEKRLK